MAFRTLSRGIAFGRPAFVSGGIAPTITSAPEINGIPAPGETVQIVNATASGTPTPTVTPTLALGSLDVTGDISGGEYTIPPAATIGQTLLLTSVASNGAGPDAQDSVSVAVRELYRTQDPLNSWQFDLENARLLSATNVNNVTTNKTISEVPSFFPCLVDVSQDPDFDGVNHATTGERLNHLLYTSTDHSDLIGGGIYLTVIFGDLLDGTSMRYVDALFGGHLDNFSGTKPDLTATNEKLFTEDEQTETPWVGKVGSTWVMTYHNNLTGADLGQGTKQVTSNSPFGPWTVTNTVHQQDVFLNLENDDTFLDAQHTGYAYWYPTPAEATNFPHAYLIRSLYRLSGSPGEDKQMIWGADQNMENPVAVTVVGNSTPSDNPTVTVPDWEPFFAGMEIGPIAADVDRTMKWDGNKFQIIAQGGQPPGGGQEALRILLEKSLKPDLSNLELDLSHTPRALIGPRDLEHLLPGATRLSLATVITLADGSEVAICDFQNDAISGGEAAVAIPVTYTGPTPPEPALTVAVTGDAGEIIFDPIAPLDEWTATTGGPGEIIMEAV